ncbi:putative reverse transcriptase domain-containing protein [Tanacetum coccineum]
MSGCRDNQKVKYTAASFVGKAFTWWNSQIHTWSREAGVSMSWEDFKTLTKEKFCPSNKMQKLETELWNHVMVGAGHATYTDKFHELAGHLAKDCRVVPRNVNLVNARNPAASHGACFKCGGTDHYKSTCTRNNGNQARGRAFMLGAEEARQDPNIMTGLEPSDLGSSYEIEIASGKLVAIDKVIKGCKLEIDGHVFNINLIPFESGSFDVIIECEEKDRKRKITPYSRIEFRIELVPGAIPVAKYPYRLAPFEMEELSGQLKDIQDKDFIRPSSWPWEAPFFGHVINRDGIHVDPSKIEVIKNWEASRSPSEVCSFLGLAGYYCQFIENFSKIAKSLTVLTWKSKTFNWGEGQERKFQTLKDKLCNAPVLDLSDGPKDFVVYCDASGLGLGCVLMQRGKVIAYASRQLKIHEKTYTTHDLELGAVVFAFKICRYYLYGTKSVIYIDHKSLQHIFNQKELNMRQRRRIKLFSDYDCEIRYHPGKENVVADTLSRKERIKPKRIRSMNMTLQSCIKSKILAAQEEASDEIAGLQRGLDEMIECRSDGALYYLDRIWVPLKGDVRTLIMDEAHKLKYFVHPKADKMYYDLRDRYWWSGMKKDIVVYVSRFLTSLNVKAEHQRPFGLLQQPEIPEWK